MSVISECFIVVGDSLIHLDAFQHTCYLEGKEDRMRKW